MKKTEGELENIRVKYSSAVDLHNSEAQIQWTRYSAILVINTILITLISLTYSKDFVASDFLRIIIWFTPVLGLIFCENWTQITKRGFMWSRHWMSEANELEGNLVGERNPIKEGEKIQKKIGEINVTEKASLFIIKAFKIIYYLLLVNNLISFFSSNILFNFIIQTSSL